MECPRLQSGDAFGNQSGTAVDETRYLCAVRLCPPRNIVVVALVRLAEMSRIGVRNGAVRAHPRERCARVQSAGESDADLLADGQCLQNAAHAQRLHQEASAESISILSWIPFDA